MILKKGNLNKIAKKPDEYEKFYVVATHLCPTVKKVLLKRLKDHVGKVEHAYITVFFEGWKRKK